MRRFNKAYGNIKKFDSGEVSPFAPNQKKGALIRSSFYYNCISSSKRDELLSHLVGTYGISPPEYHRHIINCHNQYFSLNFHSWDPQNNDNNRTFHETFLQKAIETHKMTTKTVADLDKIEPEIRTILFQNEDIRTILFHNEVALSLSEAKLGKADKLLEQISATASDEKKIVKSIRTKI